MPEINSKRVQNKSRQKKAKQENAKKAKKRPRTQSDSSNANITWESKIQKKEEKTSSSTLYLVLGGLFLLFLFVLWALVEDRPTLLAKERAREKAEAYRNATNAESNMSRKNFNFESSVVFNSTQLTDVLKQLSDPESIIDRLVMVAFDDSTGEEAMGDILKLKLFRKMEAVAKALPRKKVFQRYEEEELPLIVLFDCGNTNDEYAEKLCTDIIQKKTPNVLIFRKMNKPRVLPQEHRSDNQIINYLYGLMQPPVVFLEERSECEDFVTDDKYLNVVFFGTDDSMVFEAVADSLRDFARFGRTKNPSNAEAFFAEMPSILAWRTFGENPVSFGGNISDAQSIHTFVLNQYLPALGEFNERTQHQYMKRNLPIVWIAFEPNDDISEILLPAAEDIAKQYMGALSFVKLDVHEQPKMAENLGIKVKEAKDEGEEESAEKQEDDPSELPQVLIMNQIANLKRVIDMDRIEESITAVLNEYFQKLRGSRGDIQSELEDIEEDNDDEESEDDESDTEEAEDSVNLDSQTTKEDL